MPLVRIDLHKGRPPATVTAIADSVHAALVETVGVPEKDRFQVVAEHDAGRFFFPPEYLGVSHADPVFIQITLNTGRTVEMKQRLYARLADLLASSGIPRNDVIISLVEVSRDCWSFGDGKAQYV